MPSTQQWTVWAGSRGGRCNLSRSGNEVAGNLYDKQKPRMFWRRRQEKTISWEPVLRGFKNFEKASDFSLRNARNSIGVCDKGVQNWLEVREGA